jgi:UDP-N-acetyl-D-mannosaminuronic acid dehydrogenase
VSPNGSEPTEQATLLANPSGATADVAVIGLGRVGLPLALAFADLGLRVIGVDNDPEKLAAVGEGRMPFHEPGAQEVLDRVRDRLVLADRAAEAHAARHIVLTLGTPALSHVEIDLRQIRAVLDDLLPHLRPGHAIHLRSTIAPRTTEFVAGYLAKHRGFDIGTDVFVAHVPERIASARFFEEISTLPCIIGGVGDRSGEVAAELFGRLGAPIVETTPVQAELAKIWTNILRYATFALPNLLMMDCEQYDANVFEVIDLINRDYPRGGIALPGFTAGTCLRKDFTFSEERSNAPGMLLAVSRVNESVPLFLVKGIRRRLGDLNGRKVAVLGLAFKGGTDDERDSLSHKLIRLLDRELADVAVHDPRVPTPTQPLEDAVRGADAVVVATNHPEFCTPETLRAIVAGAGGDALIVDPWNCWGAAEVFASAREVAERARAAEGSAGPVGATRQPPSPPAQ